MSNIQTANTLPTYLFATVEKREMNQVINKLKEVDYIAAEDTRQTKKLCNYFDITTPLISYHEHNKEQSGRKIIDLLKDGKDIGLVSDAGMPSISDPGYEVVVEALEEKLYVVPLPGANAALTALIASGLVSQPFYFYGFLDRQKKEKKKELHKEKLAVKIKLSKKIRINGYQKGI